MYVRQHWMTAAKGLAGTRLICSLSTWRGVCSLPCFRAARQSFLEWKPLAGAPCPSQSPQAAAQQDLSGFPSSSGCCLLEGWVPAADQEAEPAPPPHVRRPDLHQDRLPEHQEPARMSPCVGSWGLAPKGTVGGHFVPHFNSPLSFYSL